MSLPENNVLFWTLRQKFVDNSDSVPENSQQVLYYSLAIGHHVGVIDCLNTVLSLSLSQYESWVSLLEEGAARRKMQGLLTFGEIVIDSTHVAMLSRALAPLADTAPSPWREWSRQFIDLLDDIACEPAIYLMVRQLPADRK